MGFHLPLSFFSRLTCLLAPGLIPGLRISVLVTVWWMHNENPSKEMAGQRPSGFRMSCKTVAFNK